MRKFRSKTNLLNAQMSANGKNRGFTTSCTSHIFQVCLFEMTVWFELSRRALHEIALKLSQ